MYNPLTVKKIFDNFNVYLSGRNLFFKCNQKVENYFFLTLKKTLR